ncbi:MAG: 1-phosphofructokinase [Anaerolineae bacterium]
MIYTVTLNPALDRELTVPAIQYDEVLRATEVRIDYGGKGFNVSRALCALGERSVALGFLGGMTGQRFVDGLPSLGIAVDFVEIKDETRTNISIVTSNRARYLKVNEPGPEISRAEQAALLDKIKGLAKSGDWWVLSGNLPRGVSADFYAQMIDLVQAASARVILDTSGEPLKHGCEAGPFLVKPNAEEAAELTGLSVSTPDNAREAVKAITVLGAQNVFMSFGKLGALLFDGERAWFAAAPTIEEKNPIGAGDCAVAGLTWGLSRSLSASDALRWGVASGSAAASLAGTTVGDYALVSTLVERVEVQPLWV